MSRNDRSVSSLSCAVIAMLIIVGLLTLIAKLREVQLYDTADYAYANERQSIRRVQTEGVRGRILDRNGKALAENRASVSIVCDAAHFQRRTWSATAMTIFEAINKAEKIIGRPSAVTLKMIERHLNQSLAMPLTIWRDVDFETLARFSEHEAELDGFSCEETVERHYPFGALASHLIGYVGRDRGYAEAGDERYNIYQKEMRGRAGLEFYYDSFLRGVPGEKKVLVDARGFAMREWNVVAEQCGLDLKLTLDIDLQQIVEEQLKGCKGACVVIDPRDGEVLAMASSPTFDPNRFVPVLSTELYNRYASDPDKPLLNRAVGGTYAPGSTFKPITAIAGMKTGHSTDIKYECTGSFYLGEMELRCARRWGHGELDLKGAIMRSCNPYFCNLGMEAGTNAIISVARAFGLGRGTGIDFSVDAAGVVPDAQWKMRTYHEKWYSGDLAQMSIGQGMLLVTPLQMARIAGALGTGKLVVPHLKEDIPVVEEKLPYPDWIFKAVREGMYMVVAGDGSERGPAWRAGDGVEVTVAGKTGTAEIGRGAKRRKNTWFIAYAPVEDPTVALAVIIENGESGGSTAAPKAGAILKEIFR